MKVFLIQKYSADFQKFLIDQNSDEYISGWFRIIKSFFRSSEFVRIKFLVVKKNSATI